MTNCGRELVKERWHGHEHATMRRLRDAGAAVPYPVSFGRLLSGPLKAHGSAPALGGALLAAHVATWIRRPAAAVGLDGPGRGTVSR